MELAEKTLFFIFTNVGATYSFSLHCIITCSSVLKKAGDYSRTGTLLARYTGAQDYKEKHKFDSTNLRLGIWCSLEFCQKPGD